jgi:peptidoglycan hydrolase CwlO-like protein
MEEILKQILGEIKDLKVVQVKTDQKIDKLDTDISALKNEVKQVNKKVDSITEVVAKTMEEVTELKDKVEKQDVEIRVIRGGK